MNALSPLELASGLVLGRASATGDLARRHLTASPGPDPASTLEDAVRPALQRPPCLVSFSGGLDSSLVLAVADRLARCEGLPRPIPVTLRFPDAPRAQEDSSQERVVRALGCRDWERITVTEELDLLGPVAAVALRRHGVRHPANAFLHLPMLERAAGGSLLTGIGGDQILGGWPRVPRWRRPWWWPGRGPVGGRTTPDLGWLRPAAQRVVRRRLARERASQPSALDRRVCWHLGRRDLRLTLETIAMMAEGAGAVTTSPLADPGFVAALAAHGRATGGPAPGLAGRRALLADVFDDLPPAVISRRGKATFSEVFRRRNTVHLLGRWDGGGVDETLVDPVALRHAWARPTPTFLTALLAQQLWLDGHLARVPTPSSSSLDRARQEL